jgi:hypothetical protein
MRKIIAIVVLFAMLSQLFSSVMIIANYVANKEYISKNLCENRTKPKMHCNGKCHLMKQLQKDSKKEKSPLTTAKFKTSIQFVEEEFVFSFMNNSVGTISYVNFIVGFPVSKSSSVFHPPSIC